MLAWVGLFAVQPSQPDSKNQAVPTSLQVLLKPGQVYTLRFDKSLPVSPKEQKEPPYREWGSGYVRLLDVQPRSIRFRTLTLQEALKEVERMNAENRKWGGELIDPDFIRAEYKGGSPFVLHYFSWAPPQNGKPVNETLVEISFSIEAPSRKAIARKVRIKAEGLEIKPLVNRTGVRFFLTPAGKEKVLLVMPTEQHGERQSDL